MRTHFSATGGITRIEADGFTVPFTERFGFFVGDRDIPLTESGNTYIGTLDGIAVSLQYEPRENCLALHLTVQNNTAQDMREDVGFHLGVDSLMTSYPQWHTTFFPTLLRCEKTHLWGYYMNTAQNALAFVTEEAVASYDIGYNRLNEDHCGHRILGTDMVFIKDADLPERHPTHLRCLAAGAVYENTLYLIPVSKPTDILPAITKTAGVPTVQATKYTYEMGETPQFTVYANGGYHTELTLPDGTTVIDGTAPMTAHGLYTLRVRSDNGKEAQALFCCRETWDFYLYHAAKEALKKPQKASTHVESYYGLFSLFLSLKYVDDAELRHKAYACFDEIMPFMYDFTQHTPLVIPNRIQNTALLISLLCDVYEADPAHNTAYLYHAAQFGDWMRGMQDDKGVYRNEGIHYTCVIYIAKSMLELALAEKDCADPALRARYADHYLSAKRAVDELVQNRDNIDTEGELTLEDGMISCSALQIAMLALTLPQEEREPYIEAAEYMMGIHACLEQRIIPDCRMNGGSLRFWESQYDVMARENMLNSPHGWTGWTAYAHYYLYRLTGKGEYLVSLMNCLGSCAQLMDFDGNLRWSFCAQPYVKARSLVPDTDAAVQDGYAYVEVDNPAYRGKYEERVYGEQYIEMISDWYRTGEQKVTGGYAFCEMFLPDGTVTWVDNQGGCCDNDVHEIFKCIEECVLRKAFVHENEDGSLLTYGCRAERQGDALTVTFDGPVTEVVYCLKSTYRTNLCDDALTGCGCV